MQPTTALMSLAWVGWGAGWVVYGVWVGGWVEKRERGLERLGMGRKEKGQMCYD
jgi:hypothetical protein